ncbi:MAG: protein kinase [Lachnospiraceae bacterium]|nr:protein kinase [Lachnospiraceae bacterium]
MEETAGKDLMAELHKSFDRQYQVDPLPEELSGDYVLLSVLSCRENRRVCLLERRDTKEKRIYKESSDLRGLRTLETEYCFLLVLGETKEDLIYRREEATSLEYLIRPYYEGVTLLQYVENRGLREGGAEGEGLPLSEAVDLLRSVLGEVKKLHRQEPPLVHRDLKPSNILRCPDGSCKIIDFDSLREYKEGEEHDTFYMGTRVTAAPEQFGFRQTTVRTDIYTLGVLFLYLLTGDYMAEGAAWDGLPKEVRYIIGRCLSFDPEKRYATVTDLDRELICLKRFGCSRRRMRLRVFGGLTGCLLIAGILLGLLVRGRGHLWVRPVTFSNPQVEAAVRKSVPGLEEGPIYPEDLSYVTTLVLCGDRTFASWEQHKEFHDDNWALCDEELAPMEPADLSDLEKFPNLINLVLCNQGLETVSDLSVYPKLKAVNLFHNSIEDLSFFEGTENLDIVDLTRNQVDDLTQLRGNRKLRSLKLRGNNVEDMTPLSDLNLQILDLLDNPVSDFSFLDHMPNLTMLRVSNADAEDVERITTLKKLYELEIFNYRLENLEPLTVLRDMDALMISQSPCLVSLEGVQRFRALSFLDVQGTGITDLSLLKECKYLNSLSINQDAIKDITVLREIPRLRRLSIDYSQEEAVRALDLTGVEIELH